MFAYAICSAYIVIVYFIFALKNFCKLKIKSFFDSFKTAESKKCKWFKDVNYFILSIRFYIRAFAYTRFILQAPAVTSKIKAEIVHI